MDNDFIFRSVFHCQSTPPRIDSQHVVTIDRLAAAATEVLGYQTDLTFLKTRIPIALTISGNTRAECFVSTGHYGTAAALIGVANSVFDEGFDIQSVVNRLAAIQLDLLSFTLVGRGRRDLAEMVLLLRTLGEQPWFDYDQTFESFPLVALRGSFEEVPHLVELAFPVAHELAHDTRDGESTNWELANLLLGICEGNGLSLEGQNGMQRDHLIQEIEADCTAMDIIASHLRRSDDLVSPFMLLGAIMDVFRALVAVECVATMADCLIQGSVTTECLRESTASVGNAITARQSAAVIHFGSQVEGVVDDFVNKMFEIRAQTDEKILYPILMAQNSVIELLVENSELFGTDGGRSFRYLEVLDRAVRTACTSRSQFMGLLDNLFYFHEQHIAADSSNDSIHETVMDMANVLSGEPPEDVVRPYVRETAFRRGIRYEYHQVHPHTFSPPSTRGEAAET